MPAFAAVVPALAAVGGGSALAGGAMLGSTALGAYSTIKGMSDAKKAANAAGQAGQQAQVDIPGIAQMTQDQALKNIALSRQVEDKYNPGNNLLRQGSVLGLISQLGSDPNNDIYTKLNEQFQGAPMTAQSADSELLKKAIAQATNDLALGGKLPLDVRNMVARTAAGQSGSVSGGLSLGRDIQARDLGLTSLDLQQRRLGNAQSLGQAELGGNQFNANMRQRANEFGLTNNLNLAQLMSQLNGADFNKFLASAQFGQSLQGPQVGLDPSAIANLSVGNTNAGTQAALNAAGIKAQSGNNLTNFGGQLFGYGFGNMTNPFAAAGGSAPYKAPTAADWNPYGVTGGTYNPPKQ